MILKMSLREHIIEDWQGSRDAESFTHLSDDEFIGYISAMTVNNYSGKFSFTVLSVIETVRDLYQTGALK